MAIKFAIANGNFSSGSTWDNGTIPSAGDIVYSNGYTVAIDQNIDVDSLRNDTTIVGLVDSCVPVMTSNNSPSGFCSGSTNLSIAYQAFDQNINTAWNSTVNNGGILQYQFSSSKVIKRYYIRKHSNQIYHPKDWTFQGSNDGVTWTTLDTVTNHNSSLVNYNSSILANSTSYSYYRLNVTTTFNASYPLFIYSLEMTESTSTSLGYGVGGGFTLTGSRNLNFSGEGVVASISTILTINSTSGSTVNLTKSGSGYIIGPNCLISSWDGKVVNINGACTINYYGDLYGTRNTGCGYNRGGGCYMTLGATLNIYGNVYASDSTSFGYDNNYVLNIFGSNSTVNIVGNVYGNSLVGTRYYNGIYCNAPNGTVNITGTISSSIGNAIYVANSTNINHTGICQVTSSNSYPAIIQTVNTSLITMTSPILNVGNTMALSVYKMRFYSGSSVQYQFQDTTNSNKILYSAGASGSTLGLPLTTDVRNNVKYGVNNELTGSLIVADPSNIRKGVLTDNTIGTADLTAEDILNAISGSSNPIAIRLRNVSTVQTTGDQISSLI